MAVNPEHGAALAGQNNDAVTGNSRPPYRINAYY
jgi:hypothetical protein